MKIIGARSLRVLLGGGVLAVLIAGAASAEQEKVKAPIYKAPLPAAWSWTGFYIGIDGGYAFNERAGNPTCINPAGVSFGAGCANGIQSGVLGWPSGGLVGDEAGYNYQSGVVNRRYRDRPSVVGHKSVLF